MDFRNVQSQLCFFSNINWKNKAILIITQKKLIEQIFANFYFLLKLAAYHLRRWRSLNKKFLYSKIKLGEKNISEAY